MNEEWNPETWLFDLLPIRGSHTGQKIFETFNSSVGCIKTKTMSIVLDNASNNDTFIRQCVATYDGFEHENRIRCMAHISHLVAKVRHLTACVMITSVGNYERS